MLSGLRLHFRLRHACRQLHARLAELERERDELRERLQRYRRLALDEREPVNASNVLVGTRGRLAEAEAATRRRRRQGQHASEAASRWIGRIFSSASPRAGRAADPS